MLGAGLVAKKACEFGLEVKPWVKTSLAPGSGVVTKYLLQSGLQKYLNQQGFNIVGYGCTTCIGNSGELDESVASAISENDIVAAAVLSGNRDFEGRVHPPTRANYLASPPLVVAYALAGTVDIDFEKEPVGTGKDGKSVHFRDIWPSNEEIAERGVDRRDFNSYGSRRGNDEVMARGAFANIRIVNKILKGEVEVQGRWAGHYYLSWRRLRKWQLTRLGCQGLNVTGADTYLLFLDIQASCFMLLHIFSIFSYSPFHPQWFFCSVQGVKAVIAKSFERIHRSNLVGMGIIPLCFKPGEDADFLGLTGHERYTIDLPSKIKEIRPGQDVTITTDTGKSFTCTAWFDTKVELEYVNHGGILPYVIRNLNKD
ncbi:hypothetical protein SCA6_018688 [Theobroma cacao]